mgnify:CR=1
MLLGVNLNTGEATLLPPEGKIHKYWRGRKIDAKQDTSAFAWAWLIKPASDGPFRNLNQKTTY